MINRKLLSRLVEVGKQWATGEKEYSFETRLCCPLNENQYPQGGFTVIIDVQGFYYDENWTKPIKLHHEVVISMDEFNNQNLTEVQINEYSKSMSHKLNEITSRAYQDFKVTLQNENATNGIYTSDIFWMK